MNYLWAFLIGGAICAVGQLLIDMTKLTPARILTGYVVAGVVLSAVGLYAPLAEFAGAGASVPLLGFGHLLAKGVRTAVAENLNAFNPTLLMRRRRADCGFCGHHRKPCLRCGVQPCGQKPRPELMFCLRCFATFCARRLVNWGQNGGEAHETQRTDRIVGAVGGAVPVHGAGAAARQPVAARAGTFVPGAYAGGGGPCSVGGVVGGVAAAAVAAGAAAGAGAAAEPCRTVRGVRPGQKTKTPVPGTRYRGFVRQSNCAIKRSC